MASCLWGLAPVQIGHVETGSCSTGCSMQHETHVECDQCSLGKKAADRHSRELKPPERYDQGYVVQQLCCFDDAAPTAYKCKLRRHLVFTNSAPDGHRRSGRCRCSIRQMLAVALCPHSDAYSNGCSNNQRHNHPGPFERSLGDKMAGGAFFRRILDLAVGFRKRAIIGHLWGRIWYHLSL